VDQVWEGLYERGQAPQENTTLPKTLRAQLDALARPGLALEATQRGADDQTVKWLWTLADGAAIETVLMRYPDRATVCVSSQAGCAMACGFCATGQGGYDRNLSVGEILEQIVRARVAAAPRRLSNVVFMGMGEPFANYERLVTALRRTIDELGIGARHITVSTIGLVPQILRFADEGLQVGLAVSLHAANDTLRSELIPVNRRHPVEEVVAACQLFRERTRRRVSFEWAMIDGVNDRDCDADELADVARRARAHVNLIPLNPTPGWPTVGSPVERIAAFAERLATRGVTTTVRRNRGTDIDAACGQLKAERSTTPVRLRDQS
ncbi:MAG: 23S rRNA (adenine(2503)-C(2))-methyltransferase RlmN, partial [Acidimicrobiia bacterium]|nr:23S rRNA (adenine(2503)-C(2))-methyltransferase RlmN [Acidimicrobiia bacterium]